MTAPPYNIWAIWREFEQLSTNPGVFNIMDRDWWYPDQIWALPWTVNVKVQNITVELELRVRVWKMKTQHSVMNNNSFK